MSRPEDPGRSTEPMSPSATRGSTQPLPSSKETTPSGDRSWPDPRDRRLWLVAGGLALILAFVAGFLVGRGQGEAPAGQQGPTDSNVCMKAVRANQRAVALQDRAVATLGALVKATADGEGEVVVALNEELETLSTRTEKARGRADRLAERCGA